MDFSQILLQLAGTHTRYYALPQLHRVDLPSPARLPFTIRVLLESAIRHCGSGAIGDDDVRAFATWQPNARRTETVRFQIARILMHDFTGVPLFVDLTALRDALVDRGASAKDLELQLPVVLIIDHSVQVDHCGTQLALASNEKIEQSRNSDKSADVTVAIDTATVAGYYRVGGVLNHLLNHLLEKTTSKAASDTSATSR